MTDKFEILTAREHCRRRPNMFVGGVNLESIDRFTLGKWRSVEYIPALMKMIDEIIENAIDEAIRTGFSHSNEIHIYIRPDHVSVLDNGRGIPHDFIIDSESNEKLMRPAAAWTRMRAGTSFEDNRITIGTNGIGSAAVNFLSKKFLGKTWQNGKIVVVNSTNGAEKTTVKKRSSSEKATSGTYVEFYPDFDLFDVDGFDKGDHYDILEDRLMGLQIAFPEIRFKLNGKYLQVTNLKKYAKLFLHSENASSVVYQKPTLQFLICASVDGYRTTGYINGVNTRLGGSYNDWIINNIVEVMVGFIKKKYKVDVTKSSVKNGLALVLFARNFTNPQFDSQTKERLTNTAGQVKAHYEAAKIADFDTIARKIMACDDIIEPIVEAQVAKKAAADKRALALAQKKLKRAKVQSHIDGDSGATLFLLEGASATGFFLKVRDRKKAGAFPLKGVVKNTWDAKPTDILENKELRDLIAILNLDINDPNSIDNMSYQNIATLADADHDGNHITGLLMAFFYRFWPRLFDEKRIHMTRTPIMISTKGKSVKWFYGYDKARQFKNTSAGYAHRYIKGLASLTEEEYDKIINQPVMDTIMIDNPAWFEVAFGDDSGHRKDWLYGRKPAIIEEG